MPETFEELIGRHLDDLYSAALCFTLDEHRAEELLQEALIGEFHEFGARRRPRNIRSDLLGRLVACYVQRERRRGRDPLETSAGDDTEEALADGSPTRLGSFPEPGTPAHATLRSWLRGAWSELDPGDRLVLWLADVERLAHARVASMTGITEDHVRRRHYRARYELSRGAQRQLRSRRFGAG